jgi:hypothetical protein
LKVLVSFGAWRKLADVFPQKLFKCAYPAFTGGMAASGLRSERPKIVLWLHRAHAPDRRRQEQRQTAHGRIGSQSDPGRRRQDQRNCRGDNAEFRGYEYHSSKHLPKPPRERLGQIERHAWQDCGRAWVNLRQVVFQLVRCKVTAESAKTGIGPAEEPLQVSQSRVAKRRWKAGSNNKVLKNGQFRDIWSTLTVRRPGLTVAGCRANHQQANWSCRCHIANRVWSMDVTEDCLSFVMPQQQGAGVVVGGDGR